MADYYELDSKIMNIRDEEDVLKLLKNGFELSTKSGTAYGYVAGFADALMWANIINKKQYTEFLKSVGL